MASRLMAQYNVTQADLLDQATEDSDYASMGGQSVVMIMSTKGSGSRVILQHWVQGVAQAMEVFFDCSSYSMRLPSSIEMTFYGIAPNTVAAAIASEMAHNLILEWARSKTGRNVKYSYCLGVSRGLISIARAEKQKEEMDAKEEEQSQASKGKEIDTHDQIAISFSSTEDDVSQTPPKIDSFSHVKCNSINDEGSDSNSPSNYDARSDGENDDVEPTFIETDEKPLDMDLDFDNELRKMIPKQNSEAFPPVETVPKSNSDSQLTANPWNSSQALVKFRQSAKRVADEFLKAQNVKLSNGRARHISSSWNHDAYLMGVEDSKKIDVKRRRIEDS